MIWTGILLLICHVLSAIGSDNSLTWTNDVHHSASTFYDSDGNYKTRAELKCPDCLRAYSYTQQANKNKAPVYSWSKLGRKLPAYSNNQQNRQQPNAWQRQNRLGYQRPRYNLNRGNNNNVYNSRNAWNQAFRQQYQDSSYQQLLNPSYSLQDLYRKGNQQGYSRLDGPGNLNRGYNRNQVARNGNRNQVNDRSRLARRGNQGLLNQQQRQGYRNPNVYNNLYNRRPLYLNQNRQGPYNRPPKYWKDYRLGYNNPSSLWNRQGRVGYNNARKQHEWNISPSYLVNSQKRQAVKSLLQNRLGANRYKNPSSVNRQNVYRAPTYSASGLNRLQLNRGALKRNGLVPYSQNQRQGNRDNSVDQQYLDTNNLLNVNGLRQNNRNK